MNPKNLPIADSSSASVVPQTGDRAPRMLANGDIPPLLPVIDELMERLGQVAFTWDATTDIMTWSGSVGAVFGGMPGDALEKSSAFDRFVEQGHTLRVEAVTQARNADDFRYQVEYALRVGDDAPLLWVEESGCWFADRSGLAAGIFGIIRPIGDRHARDEKLRTLAQRDAMTGELDRTQLLAALDGAAADAVHYQGACAFMLLGINHLSRINDAFGFDVADEVICEVVGRIRPLLRGGDVMGRFSNNKFGIILKNCAGDDMAGAADRFLSVIRDGMMPTSSGPVAVTISIGGVSVPRYASTVEKAVTRAQEALDTAKRFPSGVFQPWNPNAVRESLRRQNIRITDEIVSALNDQRIITAFEPVVSAASRQVAFHECLVRMKRPDGRIQAAHDIVPAAERLGLIHLIDHRVLELAIAELCAFPDIQLSLNISPGTTRDPDWLANIEALLDRSPGVAERLIVEITETQAIDDLDDIRGFVTHLKKLGARIAIDDFGAGYTSFRNLRRLDVDMVKIDGAFVQNLTQSPDDRTFVQTLIDLARRLDIQTVAEWVRNEESATMLRDWGCDYLQGNLIGLGSLSRPWAGGDDAEAAPTLIKPPDRAV